MFCAGDPCKLNIKIEEGHQQKKDFCISTLKSHLPLSMFETDGSLTCAADKMNGPKRRALSVGCCGTVPYHMALVNIDR